MKISVVLATYNGSVNILEQMISIKNQKREADEVIISDDCSTDNTLEIVQEYICMNNLHNWRIISNKVNKGWKSNFISGMKIASGDLILPCDQDDIWNDNKLLIMEKIMEENPNINVLVSNYEEFFSDGKRIVKPHKENGELEKIDVSRRFMGVDYPGCTYCVRKEYFNNVVSFWREDYAHDALLWRLAMFDESLYAINMTLVNQRKYNNSTFTLEARTGKNYLGKINSINFVLDTITMLDTYINGLDRSNYNIKKKILNEAEKWARIRLDLYRKFDFVVMLRLIKYIGVYPRKKQYLSDLYYAFTKK